jgi:V8-like Glu-specific endopeptidase
VAGVDSRTKIFVGSRFRAIFAAAVFCGLTGLEPVALAGQEADIIEQPANLPDWFLERRIVGENNLEKIEAAKTSRYYDMTRPIAIVKDTSGQGFCTGWRVAEDMFVTNFHCWDCGTCNVVFELDYDDPDVRARNTRSSAARKSWPATNFMTTPFTVYRARKTIRTEKPRPAATASRTKAASSLCGRVPCKTGQALIVAGHPQARTKEIDRSKDCKLASTEPEEMGGRMTIRHTCDTEGGSSGSPVLDRKTGYAVALHWGGEDGYNMSIPMSLGSFGSRENPRRQGLQETDDHGALINYKKGLMAARS